MKLIKTIAIILSVIFLSGCSILSELTALKKCEFSFHSAENPVLAGINVMEINSFSDLNFMNGQKLVSSVLSKTMPFGITVNVEAKNPGVINAAVNKIEWIAYIDDIQISSGQISDRIEIPANGGTTIIPVRVESDLFEYMEGDNPKTMLNFALNLVDAGGQPTRLSMKIKPSVYIGGTMITSPEYFKITKEFKSGN
ncbi:MAG TPA: hypothetical protein VJ951_02170 [Bacteroidales bacterium]|nr:hypothetical protein [Bacteroidales bacterium]